MVMNHKPSAPKTRKFVAVTVIVVLLGCGFWLAVWGRSSEPEGRKVAFYQDSMHPWVKSDRPGKCTICAMDLTPIYAGDKGFGVSDTMVVLNRSSVSVLNVKSDEVNRRPLCRTLHVAGILEPDETRRVTISAPAPGRIDRLEVASAGIEVERGKLLLTLFSPELVQKGRLLGTAALSQLGSPNEVWVSAQNLNSYATYFVDLVSPLSGTTVERPVSRGQFVVEGEKLLTIVDTSVVWFRFDVYEQQLPWCEVGQKLEIVVPALPGRVFSAVVALIEPVLSEATRTVKVRADVKNPKVRIKGCSQRLLRFGMYAEGNVVSETPNVLTVPRTAVLCLGRTAHVYVDKGDGAYEKRRVRLGRQGDECWEVLQGLEEGERVVSSGNVLIDAQAQFSQKDEADSAAAVADAGGESPGVHGAGTPAVQNAEPDEDREAPAASQPAAEARGGMASAMPHGAHAMTGRPERSAPPMPMPASANESVAPHVEKFPPVWPDEEFRRAQRQYAALKASHARAALVQTAAGLPKGEAERLLRGLQPTTGSSVPSADHRHMAASAPMAVAGMTLSGSGPTLSDGKGNASPEAPGEKPRTIREAAPSGPQVQQAAASGALTAAQRQAFKDFITEAAALSEVLAADDVGQFNLHLARLPVVLPPLQKELAASACWDGLLKRLAAAGRDGKPATDLAAARHQFLALSTATVELAKQLRKEDAAFAGLKIYHCPMAPKPGLWVQARGPLRNPFYGSQMLMCGEEVKP
jgi:multidrug efflux pump subunit AcrA (membrane-fusion protein)